MSILPYVRHTFAIRLKTNVRHPNSLQINTLREFAVRAVPFWYPHTCARAHAHARAESNLLVNVRQRSARTAGSALHHFHPVRDQHCGVSRTASVLDSVYRPIHPRNAFLLLATVVGVSLDLLNLQIQSVS